jgi:hypothetical protein
MFRDSEPRARICSMQKCFERFAKGCKLLDVYTEDREHFVKSYKMHASSCSYLKRLFCILMEDFLQVPLIWTSVCYFKFNIAFHLCKLVNNFSNNSLFLLFCTFVYVYTYHLRVIFMISCVHVLSPFMVFVNGVPSASWGQLRNYLNEKVAAPG